MVTYPKYMQVVLCYRRKEVCICYTRASQPLLEMRERFFFLLLMGKRTTEFVSIALFGFVPLS